MAVWMESSASAKLEIIVENPLLFNFKAGIPNSVLKWRSASSKLQFMGGGLIGLALRRLSKSKQPLNKCIKKGSVVPCIGRISNNILRRSHSMQKEIKVVADARKFSPPTIKDFLMDKLNSLRTMFFGHPAKLSKMDAD